MSAQRRLIRIVHKSKRATRFDVIVIGAGAAGLAAASTLSNAGKSVCLLEGRDRVGGRIFSRLEPQALVPLELGAEFVHGRSPVTSRWLRRFNTPLMDASQTRFSLLGGKPVHADRMFDEMKAALARVRRPVRDLAFADFLSGPARKSLSPSLRAFARTLVEGFDAADATRVSTLEILGEWSGSSAADAPTFRPQGGYGRLVNAIAADLDPERVELRLKTVVNEVHWEEGGVAVLASRYHRAQQFSARAAVVTLPLGVLQLPAQSPHAVRFEPELTEKHTALRGLASGPVIKVMLQFNTAFWERLANGKFRDAAFFHARGAPFPTFWTQLPLRAPILAAWCAGPNAARMAGLDESQIVAQALSSVEQLFGRRSGAIAQLRGAYLHDWQADPFACGAYSFVTVGASAARMTLARALKKTLYFAGEASDTSGAAATVAGALRSGERAAQRMLGNDV